MPVLAGLGIQSSSALWVSAVVALGVPHVAMTAAFYADREARPILASNPSRYIAAPLLALSVAVAFAHAVPAQVLTYGLAVFAAWQLHHFSKQNLGCMAFTFRALGLPGPTESERRLLRLTTVASALAVPAVLVRVDVLAPLLYAGAALQVVAAVWAWRLGRGQPVVRAVALLVGGLFFLPLFALPGSIAVVAYSYAHGAQYMLMVGHLPSGRASGRRMWLVLGVAFVGVGLPLWWLSESLGAAGPLGYGIVYGLAAAHFIIDADIWRMRTPEHRAYMGRRFAFL